MPTATMTSKGQLTVPAEVREALGLKTGDKVDFFLNEDATYTFQAKTGSIMEMDGILAKYARNKKALTIEEMDAAIGEAIMEDYKRSLKAAPDNREKAS